MTDDFSIRMKDDDGLAPPASLFSPKPDKKGPKTIAILLILGSILMLSIGFGDIQNSMRDDFPDAELEATLDNFQKQDVNLTADDYQEYHDEVRNDGAYSIRGYSLAVGGMLLIIGGVLLFRLNMLGVKLSLAGAMIGLIGGFSSSWMMAQTSAELFPKEAAIVLKIWSYLCGVCMSICVLLAALPVMNSSARMALNQKLTLVNEEE